MSDLDSMSARPAAAVIDRVRASCALVADRPVRLAEQFYRELFAMAPAARGMFPADMSGQMQKMTDALLAAITTLGRPDTSELESVLRRLGREHRLHHGVQAEHYLYVGHALTRAVREVSEAQWSGALSSDWIGLYQWIARHMLAGADDLEPPVVPVPRAPDASASEEVGHLR